MVSLIFMLLAVTSIHLASSCQSVAILSDESNDAASELFPVAPSYGNDEVKTIVSDLIGPIDEEGFHALRSGVFAIENANELRCEFTDSERCCWYNVSPDRLVKSTDWTRIVVDVDADKMKKVFNTTDPPIAPYGITGAAQTKGGLIYSVLTSCAILCQPKQGTLRFRQWRSAGVTLDVCTLPVSGGDYTFCEQIKTNETLVAVNIPKQNDPFTISIIASEFSLWPGGITAVDSIFYTADDVCTPDEAIELRQFSGNKEPFNPEVADLYGFDIYDFETEKPKPSPTTVKTTRKPTTKRKTTPTVTTPTPTTTTTTTPTTTTATTTTTTTTEKPITTTTTPTTTTEKQFAHNDICNAIRCDWDQFEKKGENSEGCNWRGDLSLSTRFPEPMNITRKYAGNLQTGTRPRFDGQSYAWVNVDVATQVAYETSPFTVPDDIILVTQIWESATGLRLDLCLDDVHPTAVCARIPLGSPDDLVSKLWRSVQMNIPKTVNSQTRQLMLMASNTGVTDAVIGLWDINLYLDDDVTGNRYLIDCHNQLLIRTDLY